MIEDHAGELLAFGIIAVEHGVVEIHRVGHGDE